MTEPWCWLSLLDSDLVESAVSLSKSLLLSELALGQRGVIADVTGQDAVASRLAEMGVLEGEEIELVARAPLGDPLEFSIRGYRLSLRKAEAARVLIHKIS